MSNEQNPGDQDDGAERDQRMAGKSATIHHLPVDRLDAAFDRWLKEQLHRLYDEVLSEDIPDEMLRLIEKFNAPNAKKDPPDPS